MSVTGEDIEQASPGTEGGDALARMEARLHEAEQRFERLMDLIPDALVLVDDQNRIRYVNRRALRLVGADTREDVLGHSIFDYLAHEEGARPGKHELRQGRLRVLNADGDEVPVEAAAVKVPYEGGEGMLGRAQDLRQRRRIEQALSQTEDLFRRVFEANPAAVTITTLKDGTVLAANPAAKRMSGFDPTTYVGTPLAGHWAQPEQREAIVARVRADDLVENEEVRVLTPAGDEKIFQGSYQRIELHGETCMLSVVLDVTEQRRAQEALHEREAILRSFYETVPTMMGVVEVHGEDILHISDSGASAAFFGTTSEAMHRRFASDLGAPEEVIQKWIDAYHEARDTGAPARLEYLHERKQDARWLSAIVSHIQTLPEGTDRYSYVITDVTDRKAVEAELRQAKEEAESIARLRNIILNNLTHEVRTPLTVILGFTSMLRKGVRPQFERFVSLIERSGRRLMLMLDTILDLAQLEVGAVHLVPRALDAVEVVESAVETMRPQAEAKGLALRLERPEESMPAHFDQRLLTRVLHNLLDNAIKFTEEGEVRLLLRADADTLYIEVHDTGIGIDELYMEHLFDEFSQESTGLERTYQGSGLGLAVSKRLVELAGGHIEVESRKGRGSVFTVSVPRYVED